MSAPLEGIVENGLLRPLEPLPFAEKQHVWIRVEEVKPMSMAEWLAHTQKHHDEFLSKNPPLTDSTEIIRQDRMREADRPQGDSPVVQHR